MILVTTTPSVDGYVINSYQGIVFGEVISGVNMFKDIGAGLRNMFGGRSQGYEEELMKARNEAILEMQQRAEAMGAHAVVAPACVPAPAFGETSHGDGIVKRCAAKRDG